MKPDPTNTPEAAGRLPVLAQAVTAPLTRAAIFLVVTINPGAENRAALRSFCGDLAALMRAVEFRDLDAGLSCVMGIGSDAWDRLSGSPGRQNCILSGKFAQERDMRSRHRRLAVPHSRQADGFVLRAGNSNHDASGKRCFAGR